MALDNRNDMSDAEDYSGFCFESLEDKFETKESGADKDPQNKKPQKEEQVYEKAAAERDDSSLSGFFYEDDIAYKEVGNNNARHAEADNAYKEAYEEACDDEADAEAVPFWSYLLHILLFTIPAVGVVFMLIYIISDSKDPKLKKLALVWLFVQAAAAVLIAAAVSIRTAGVL